VPVSSYGAQHWAGLMVGLTGMLPTSYYVALINDEPGEGWDGTALQTLEPPQLVSSTTYDRPALALGSGTWAMADAGYAVCTTQLNWAQLPDVDWGSLPYFAICDDHLAGNLWAWDAFTEPLTITAGSTVSIPAGSISIELASLLPSIAE